MKIYNIRTPWKMIPFIGLLLLILLSLSLYRQLELPKPTGPYAVGQTIMRWVDTSRSEVMTENPNDFREVMVLIWYPAVQGTGDSAGYISDYKAVADALAQSGELQWWQVRALQWVRSSSNLYAQPLQKSAPYPVVVLLPGNATNIEFYSSLANEISSYGYVVVGINHPYDAPAVELSDGEVAPYDRGQWSLDPVAHQAYIAERHKVKLADAVFVLDQLRARNSEPSNPLASILDLNNVAAAGHSLGGIVASDLCKADPQIKACINFDGLQKGGPFSMEESALPPAQPFLFLTKESQLHPKLIQRFESTSESYWVVVHGAAHDSFTDGPLLQPSIFPFPNEANQRMNLIETYTLAFLNQTLRGQPNTLLTPTSAGQDISVTVFPSK